jgi:hypothetical protein
MSKPLWLRIDQQETRHGSIEITWEPFLQFEGAPAVKEYRKKCAREAFYATLRSFKEQMEVGAPRELTRAGHNLFRNFVDHGFYRMFRGKDRDEIFISTRMIYVPWELVQNLEEDELPWGVRYAIGNQIRSPLDVRLKKPPVYKEHIDVLLIAANTMGLTRAEPEVLAIKDKLLQDKRIRCEIIVPDPSGRRVAENEKYFPLDYYTVLGKIQDTKFDIIHYAGHIKEPGQENDFGSALVLGEKRLLDSQTIYFNLGGTPFVFLNGCNVIWETAPEIITNIADGFILGGARGVLVPRTEIIDEDAERIALRYYEQILAAETFGEALRVIRAEEYEKDPANVNWITYILFGKPDARLFALEKEIFLSDAQLKAKILNDKIVEDGTAVLLKTATGYAMKSEAQKVEPRHLFAALLPTEIFAALYVEQAGDDFWKVMQELRVGLFDNVRNLAPERHEVEELRVQEGLLSDEVLNILKNAHAISESVRQQQIRVTDLCRAVLESKNESLNQVLAAVAKKFNFSKLSSLQDLAQAHARISFQDKLPEALRLNLFTLDGRINPNLVGSTAGKILAKCALFQSYEGEKLTPEDVFYIAALLPGTNTKNFFDHAPEAAEFNDFVEHIKRKLTEGDRRDLELRAKVLAPETETILKRAAKAARWQSLPLTEKQIIRSLIEHVKNFGNENFPGEEFLSNLELDTISWNDD